MQVENVLIANLKKFERNPRQMPGRMAEALKQSVKRFGMVEPIVVNRRGMMVIGGHQRLEAAEALGLETVPAYFVDLDETEATALNLALNKIAGEWDEEVLSELISELESVDFDCSVTGFNETEISALLQVEVPDFEPTSEGEQGKLDEKVPIKCPECGHEFTT